MNTKDLEQLSPDQIVKDWLETLDGLVADISTWVEDQPGWSVTLSDKEITEEALQPYVAPILTINAPDGRLILEPVARIVFGGTGTVELYAWPTLYRVRLLHQVNADGWVVLTDSGITLKQPWNKITFIELARELLGAS